MSYKNKFFIQYGWFIDFIRILEIWKRIRGKNSCIMFFTVTAIQGTQLFKGGNYRIPHLDLIQSKDLAWPDVLTNLPKTDAQVAEAAEVNDAGEVYKA